MPYKFNPFTCSLDYYEIKETSEILDEILTDYNETTEETKILFNQDGILYHDDNEDV